jgi:hypothetical protein
MRQSRRPLVLRIMTPAIVVFQKTCEILDIVFEIGWFVTEVLGNLGLSARDCSFICTWHPGWFGLVWPLQAHLYES